MPADQHRNGPAPISGDQPSPADMQTGAVGDSASTAGFVDSFTRSGSGWFDVSAFGEDPPVHWFEEPPSGSIALVSVLCPHCHAQAGQVGVGGARIIHLTVQCPECSHRFEWKSAQ